MVNDGTTEGFPVPPDAEAVERPGSGTSQADIFAYAKATGQSLVETVTVMVGSMSVGTDKVTKDSLAAAMVKVSPTGGAYRITDWRVGKNDPSPSPRRRSPPSPTR